MLKDYAKTSPVAFFALPILIIGLLVMSFFLYSTLLNQQINSRTKFLDRQLSITIDDIQERGISLQQEIPALAQIDNFEDVFDENHEKSSKLRARLKLLTDKNQHFIDTLFLFNRNEILLISINEKGETIDLYDSLKNYNYPLQYSLSPKIIHIKGSKSLAIIPTQKVKEENTVFVGVLFNISNLIKHESKSQFIGDYGSKFIFSENGGFDIAQEGSKIEYEFALMKKHRAKVIDNLLSHNSGSLIHTATRQGHVFLTVYRPFNLFAERFGLMFSVSESDFIKPIKTRLQIIFLSFFVIIGTIIVVFVINLKDIGKNNYELEQGREELAKALSILEAQQEASLDAIVVADEDGNLISTNKRLRDLFELPSKPRKGIKVNELLSTLSKKINGDSSWLVFETSEEKNQKTIELISGHNVAFYSSPLFDETLNNHGRIWYFRKLKG